MPAPNVYLVQLDIAWEDKAANHLKVRKLLSGSSPSPADIGNAYHVFYDLMLDSRGKARLPSSCRPVPRRPWVAPGRAGNGPKRSKRGGCRQSFHRERGQRVQGRDGDHQPGER